MTLTPGTRFGPYEIVAPLGAGGMGEVYKAKDTRPARRTVAIKVLPEGTASNPERRRRFELEARAASALNHPHICVLYDIGSQAPSTGSGQGVDYLVMEHLEGETLADRLHEGPAAARSGCWITHPRSRTPSPRRTSRASSIGTSSPATSC